MVGDIRNLKIVKKQDLRQTHDLKVSHFIVFITYRITGWCRVAVAPLPSLGRSHSASSRRLLIVAWLLPTMPEPIAARRQRRLAAARPVAQVAILRGVLHRRLSPAPRGPPWIARRRRPRAGPAPSPRICAAVCSRRRHSKKACWVIV